MTVQHSPQKPKPKLGPPKRVTRSTGLGNKPPGPPSQPQKGIPAKPTEEEKDTDHPLTSPGAATGEVDLKAPSELREVTETSCATSTETLVDESADSVVNGNSSDEFALLKAVLDPSTIVHLPKEQVVKVLSVALYGLQEKIIALESENSELKSDFGKLKSENLELKSESLEKDKRIQELMDNTLDPKPVSRKALEDRSYATVAKKSHAKGKEPMMGKKAKTG
jgi:hypothetical protein